MKAVTYWAPLDVRYTDVDDPTPGDQFGAVVQVTATGICGSDLHIYGGHGFSDDTGFVIGHESVGVVVEVGASVHRFKVGDRVLLPATLGCVQCAACAAGSVQVCDNRRESWKEPVYGISSRLPGTQAEYARVPHADVNLFRVPDAVNDDAAVVLTDNAPTGWYGARRARIAHGDTVAIIGTGPVGLMAIQAAFVMGAARVFAVEPVPHRRAMSKSLGAEVVDIDDPKSHLRELTAGTGVDAVIEAVGADATIALAMSVAGRGARVSVVGVTQNQSFPFRMAAAQVKDLDFAIGICSIQRELPTLIRLTESGRLDPGAVVTHHQYLSDGPRAYASLRAREDGLGKIVLQPGP